MSFKPIVSVIIPVFNAEKNIDYCIQSLLNQSFQNFEILIIDDGSTDNTLAVLKKYQFNERIRIIKQRNLGVSIARNSGISNASGKYIGFVDADDTVLPNYLENLVNAIRIESNIDVSICGFTIKDSSTKKIEYKTNFEEKIVSASNMISHIFDFDGPQGFVWNKLWKKEIIVKNKISFNTDIRMAEDLLFVIDYLLCSKMVNIIPTTDYVYYQNNGSLSSTFKVKKQKNNFIALYKNYKKSAYLIRKKLQSYPKLKIGAEANIVQINLGFLRNLNLNKNSSIKNSDLYIDLKSECMNYRKSYFDSSMTDNKKKIGYFLTIYCSPLMTKIDSLLNKR